MLKTIIIAALALSCAAAQARNVGRGSAVGSAMGQSSSQGNGGRYGFADPQYSLVDDYQPWPQAQMKQYAKPEFTPYDGK